MAFKPLLGLKIKILLILILLIQSKNINIETNKCFTDMYTWKVYFVDNACYFNHMQVNKTVVSFPALVMVTRGTSQSASEYSLLLKKIPTVNNKF